ncbi:MAG: pyridoxal phosphate-dependent aminotransferase [Oscillospiraceae bacterium]|nr:pyridoxal phosphate-dependent aminotransferase [Oscillospiraceae bacterium]
MYNEKMYDLGTNGCCIRELSEYGRARAAVVGPENVYDFSIGNPSIPAPEAVTQTIRQILADTDSLAIHSYTSATGDLQTRQAIAEDLNKRFGTDAGPEDLFIGCGAAPELCAVFKALAVPGARILAVAPYFTEYQPWVEGAGAEFVAVPADIPGFQIRLDAVEQLMTPNTVAIIINSPNNPAGTVYTEQTLRELAEVLTRKGQEFGHPIFIVADEPYRELVYDGVAAPFIPNIYPNTVVCYSYSKSLSLPGERIGYIYVPKAAEKAAELMTCIAGAARELGHICAPSLWQKVIARCAHLRPDLAAYDRNRRALYEALLEYGYEVAKPDGAFYLFVKAPGGNAKAFSEKAMKKDLLLVPGDDFGCPEYLRVCYCVSYEKIIKSLPIFKALMEE